jgi:long-chain acyl-CoA synthetase
MINSSIINKPAIITSAATIDYETLLRNIRCYSGLLAGKNYKNIAIYSENRPEWIYGYYAALVTGCTAVTVDYLASEEDVAYIIKDCGPDLIFSSRKLEVKLNDIQTISGKKNPVIYFDDIVTDPAAEAVQVLMPDDIDRTAVIIYTSGTTGNPKGVMLSFKNLLANVKGVSEDVKIFTPDKQTLMLLPLHHIFPLAGSMMAPLYSGGTIVMAPSMQSADIIETLKNNQVNIMIGVPRLYELLYKGIKAKIDNSAAGRMLYRFISVSGSRSLGKKLFKKVHQGLGGHLETMVSGGAALGKDAGSFFYNLGFDVLEGFGMTEAAPMITFTRPDRIKIGSPGHPLPGTEIKIVDGEITAKGPNIMKGYYNRPEETAEVLKDGWLYTGDLGRIDEKGFLYITGRKKEIIVLSNGKNINPVELEEKIEKISPYIKEAAVFLEKDSLHAVILPDLTKMSNDDIKSPEEFIRNSVITELNKTLSSYKRIMKFTMIRDELPRTRLGKLQRHKLAELTENRSGKEKKNDQMKCEEYLAVKSYLESQTDLEISPDDHLEFDIGLDSLGKISFISFIESAFGTRIEEDKLSSFQSVRKIVEFIKENKSKHHVEKVEWSVILKEKMHIELPTSWFTQNLIKFISKQVFKVYFRFKGQGLENIPDGPCIIAPNHQSYLDGLFVASFLKRAKMKNTYFYAKKKHVNNWFLKFFADKNNVIVMDLKSDLKGSILKLAEVLKRKKNLIIFPEGTRSKSGELGDFKKTFAILSKELGIPVVPVAIVGANNALSSGSIFPIPFKKVKVEFLKPVYPNENATAETIAGKVREAIRRKLHKES